MAKSDCGAHGGGNKINKPSKMPGVGFGDGFKKPGNDLQKKKKPGKSTPPKGKKPPQTPGQIGKTPKAP